PQLGHQRQPLPLGRCHDRLFVRDVADEGRLFGSFNPILHSLQIGPNGKVRSRRPVLVPVIAPAHHPRARPHAATTIRAHAGLPATAGLSATSLSAARRATTTGRPTAAGRATTTGRPTAAGRAAFAAARHHPAHHAARGSASTTAW